MEQLFPYQLAGAEWLSHRERHGLFDQMGLGKTVQAIEAMRRLHYRQELRRALVIAPPAVLWNWRREVERWGVGVFASISVIAKGTDKPEALVEGPNLTILSRGLIVNDDLVAYLRMFGWSVIVVDESHDYRGPTSKRSRVLYGLEQRQLGLLASAERSWRLTGTPMPNHPGDLWTWLWGLWPERIGEVDHETWLRAVCNVRETRYGLRPFGIRNMSYLRQAIEGTYLSRTMEQVLPLRGKRTVDELTLPPPSRAALAELYYALPDRVRLAIEEAQKERDDSPDFQVDVDRLLLDLQNSAQWSQYLRLCGEIKAPILVEILAPKLATGEIDKLVISAWHKSTIQMLVEGFKARNIRAAGMDGDTTAAQRDRMVEEFQTQPDFTVLMVNPQCCVGQTLTAACQLVIAEPSVVPSDNQQVAKRIDRLGQTRHVTIWFATLANAADRTVARLLRRKLAMIRETFDD